MKSFLKGSEPQAKKQRITIRLVRIRNPWGKKEWKGEWSVNSVSWTAALRKKLGEDSYAKGDGTFFMSYEDVLQRFHHMDVAKCRKGWKHTSKEGNFLPNPSDPLQSSNNFYLLSTKEKSWAFISLVQPKKRANTKNQFWYTDPSMMVQKRKKGTSAWCYEA